MLFTVITTTTIFSNLGLDSENMSVAQSFKDFKSIPSRAPAAIQPSTNKMHKTDKNDLLVLNKELLCKSLEEIVQDKVSKNMVMINFKLCREAKTIQAVKLENKSNGFRAQIFKREENNFTTDYIQLDKGFNQLQLEVILKDGQKLVELLEIVSEF